MSSRMRAGFYLSVLFGPAPECLRPRYCAGRRHRRFEPRVQGRVRSSHLLVAPAVARRCGETGIACATTWSLRPTPLYTFPSTPEPKVGATPSQGHVHCLCKPFCGCEPEFHVRSLGLGMQVAVVALFQPWKLIQSRSVS